MRRLVLKMSVSVDGFVAGPNGEIDWIFASMNDAAAAWVVDTLWQAGLHAMGSRTFQDMAAYWPASTEVFAAPMNAIPKAVFSRKGPVEPDREKTTTAFKETSRRRSAEGRDAPAADAPDLGGWADALFASGDLAEEIARLKAQPGKDILAHGGAGFARSLVERDLIDEYRLLVHPVALGRGLSLFGALPSPRNLKRVDTTVFPSGGVAQVYQKD